MLKWIFRLINQEGRTVQAPIQSSKVVPASVCSTDVWIKQGNAALDSGDLVTAAACYDNAARAEPSHANAWVNLAFVCEQLNRDKDALAAVETALALDPNNFDAWYVLAGLKEKLHDVLGAQMAYQKAIWIHPDFELGWRNLYRVLATQGKIENIGEVISGTLKLSCGSHLFHFHLGNAYAFSGDLSQASASFMKALELEPCYAVAHVKLANLLALERRDDEALAHFEQALDLDPSNPEYLNHVGCQHMKRGRLAQGIAFFERAIDIEPAHIPSHINMAGAFQGQGNFSAAIEAASMALRLNPNLPSAYINMSLALDELGRHIESEQALAKALALAPENVAAMVNLATIHMNAGKLDAALAKCREALLNEPFHPAAYNSLLFGLNYHPTLTAEQIYADYEAFDAILARPHRDKWAVYSNPPLGRRKLRIGYASPDFRSHAAMRFFDPLLAHHDLDNFEVFAYGEVARPDAVTDRVKCMVSHWRDTVGLTDDEMAKLIRDDGIDVLVDAAGHTGNNRLMAFARKPAPVSVSWMGFGYTTGLSAIDYFLADDISAPHDASHLFAETPWRLRRAFWAFRPVDGMGPCGPLPALRNGYITFGSLTRPIRLNSRVVRVWASVLLRMPQSRLVLDSKNFRDEATQERYIEQFVALGVDRQRLDFGFHSPPWDVLRTIDISLDCFPHNSGTTLFESLYMGTPFVTLAGRPSVGRLGASILHGLGRPQWVATSEDDYVEIAVKLASDVSALATLREGLREEMKNSSLMDETGFTRAVEAAFREMFTIWEANPNRHMALVPLAEVA